MQVWLRLLVVWFVAIALPVQGMAAVTMAHCGTSHARMAAAVVPDQPPYAGHAGHAGHAAAAAHHHHGDGLAEPDHHMGQDTASDDQAQADTPSDPARYKCSTCADCCAGTALPSAAPSLAAPTAEPAAFADKLVTVHTFVPDQPDRPPRKVRV